MRARRGGCGRREGARRTISTGTLVQPGPIVLAPRTTSRPPAVLAPLQAMSSSQQLLERSNRRLAFLRSDLLPSLAQDGSAAALGPGELDARAREVRADLVSLERAVVVRCPSAWLL